MPRRKKGKGKRKERFGRNKKYHWRREAKRNREAMNSWKKDFPETFVFIEDHYPFWFHRSDPRVKKYKEK